MSHYNNCGGCRYPPQNCGGFYTLPTMPVPVFTPVPGPAGEDGVGIQGPQGEVGETGPQGADVGISEYAYVYNLTAQSVAQNASVTFDTNGLMSAGITHIAGEEEIAFTTAGIYTVTFSVSGTEPNQFALFLGPAGNETLVAGSIYASGAGTQQNVGQVIVTVAAGDVLTLRNHLSTSAVGLATPIGGTEANVNASVHIMLVAPA